MAVVPDRLQGLVFTGVVLDLRVEVEETQVFQMSGGSPGGHGEARSPVLSCVPGSPSAPLSKLSPVNIRKRSRSPGYQRSPQRGADIDSD